ncbi:MAG: hypothetical protein WEB63_08575 [Cucumibacter sp.]
MTTLASEPVNVRFTGRGRQIVSNPVSDPANRALKIPADFRVKAIKAINRQVRLFKFSLRLRRARLQVDYLLLQARALVLRGASRLFGKSALS